MGGDHSLQHLWQLRRAQGLRPRPGSTSMRDGERGLVRVLSRRVGYVGDCAVDDRVVISMPEEIILRGSFVVYILPLAGMLLAPCPRGA